MAEILVQVSDLDLIGSVALEDFLHIKQFSDVGDYKITVEDFIASISSELSLGDFSTINQADRSVNSGNGLTGGGTLETSQTISLGTPTSITATSTNSVTATSHTHKFEGGGLFPIGGIIMWSGSIASIPTNWALCDGTNGTPNLIDRFVVGAGNLYSVGATGGSKDAVVVSHTHAATVNDSGHTHTIVNNKDLVQAGLNELAWGNEAQSGTTTTNTGSSTTGITVGIVSQGVSGTDKNLPPYYALAYIMRVS